MKLNEEERIVETKNEGEQEFLIKATPVVYKLMSSDIYKDKYLAVIRELVTNGIDAMKENGTMDKQLILELPRYTSSYESATPLRIRDYGPGLDEEGIKRIYTYGLSTRNSSNQFTGAFGIGAKAPFAYTDNFTIRSYKDGIEYQYLAQKVNSMPTIKLVEKKPTIEENGLDITIPLKNSSDISRFERAANALFKYFRPLPLCNVPLNITYQPIYSDVLCEIEDEWTLEAFVLMGGISYRAFRPDTIFSDDNSIIRQRISNIFSSRKVTLKVPMGRYSLHPSRESIDDTEENKERFKTDVTNLCNFISKAYKEEFEKNIQEHSFNYAVYQLRESRSISGGFSKKVSMVTDLESMAGKINRLDNLFYKDKKVPINLFDASLIDTSSKVYSSRYSRRGGTYTCLGKKFLIRDYNSSEKELPEGYITHSRNPELIKTEGWEDLLTERALDILGLNRNDVVKLSDIMPKPEKVKREHTPRKKYEGDHVFGAEVTHSTWGFDTGERKVYDLNRSTVYVLKDKNLDHYELNRQNACIGFINKMVSHEDMITQVIAVPKSWFEKQVGTEIEKKYFIMSRIKEHLENFTFKHFPVKYKPLFDFFDYDMMREEYEVVRKFRNISLNLSEHERIRDILKDFDIKTNVEIVDCTELDSLYELMLERKEARLFFGSIMSLSSNWRKKVLQLVKYYKEKNGSLDGLFSPKKSLFEENEEDGGEEDEENDSGEE